MKILMVNTGVFPVPTPMGGTENYVYYLTKSLSQHAIEIDLVSDIGENAKFNRKINIHPINLPEFSLFDKGFKGYMLRHAVGGFYAFKKATKLLKSDHYDIIHVHGRIAPFLLSFFKNNTPLVFTLHDDPPSREQPNYYAYKISYKLFQETAAKKASHIIVVHTRLKNDLTNLSIDPNKISVIPTGVDVDLFKNGKTNPESSVIFVGSLTKRKGINYLLEAVSKIDNIKLIIVGDGPEMGSLRLLANSLAISERVTFAGSVAPHGLPRYYSYASIFVLPSLREALPLSLLEAMSCGLPIIATNISGMSEVIKDGYNGFLVEPANVEQLKEKIKFLAENPELCREIGKNARKTVEEKYSWDVVAKKTLKVYEKVLLEER
jgi:glycosyltransferase involved in cell wall biosynthesis